VVVQSLPAQSMGLRLNMTEENCGLRAAVEVVEELGLVCQSGVGRL